MSAAANATEPGIGRAGAGLVAATQAEVLVAIAVGSKVARAALGRSTARREHTPDSNGKLQVHAKGMRNRRITR